MTESDAEGETPPVLLIAPEPDPDVHRAYPLALMYGRLSVNDRGCYAFGEHLLVVPHGSTASVDPPGIHVPGCDFVPLGAEVAGTGGYYSIDGAREPDRYRRFATEPTTGLNFVWDLHEMTPAERKELRARPVIRRGGPYRQ